MDAEALNEKDEEIQGLKIVLNDFISSARRKRDSMGRTEGARILSVSITEAEKALSMIVLGEMQRLL